MVKQRVRVGAGVGGSKAKNSDDVNRGKKPTGSIGRDRSTVKRLHMYRTKSVKRDRDGKILDGKGDLTSRTPQDGAGRTAPNRKWFGNTRVIEQKQLQKFREQMQNVGDDTYSMLLKRRKVPMALLTETTGRELEGSKLGLLANETFEDTFSKRHWRKKPKLNASAIEELAKNAREKSEQFDADEEDKEVDPLAEYKDLDRDRVFDKGQSKRIWGELHKVIDSSDVILQVIDARDPQGTRCFWLERFVKKECAHKHLVLVLNKVDLVPTAVTARWLRILSKEFPTVAMHSSITNSYGKGTLINLLRQFGKLHSDRKSISCGLVGYPNVGKSSVINTLRGKKVANVAPIPGETKVWQYITLFRHIFLVDCPGVVHESGSNSQADSVLKGVVRVESLADTAPDYISAVLERVEREYVVKTYGILSWKDSEDFLEKMAQKTGKLLKNAEPDISAAARKVLLDFQRGKLPWFVPPPRGDVDECEPLGVIEKSGAEDRTENGIQLREQTLRGLKTKNDVDLPEWKDVSDEESESNEDEDSQENED
mmetsp:Transcript_5392/g.9494  ORF Transcript_5392/g.9494 Transcript_5392/m.9494 type:complete len:540 (-) Transcript_5392:565-2184(-)